MRLLDRIEPGTVDVVVTPECFLDGYVCTEESVTAATIRRYAIDPERSEYLHAARVWAARSQSFVIYGCMRADESGEYNTALAIDRSGRIIGRYDKVHCQTHDLKYRAGGALPVFDAEFGRFGIMICADRRWPETVRTLVVQGARVIFNPTYGMCDDRNRRMMQTRSYESEVFIVFAHPSQSLVTGPRGETLIDCVDEDEEICRCELDLSLVDRVRSGASSHLKDRRPELYR